MDGGWQMKYLLVADIAKKWNMSERSVRNYCAKGRVNGAFLNGKIWNIPENAEKPERTNKRKTEPITLLDILKEQKASKYSGGIYHKTQIELTYNSNHMEGSALSEEQTRLIFETSTIDAEDGIPVDDILETVHHFRAIDFCIDHAEDILTEEIIKELHYILKHDTQDASLSWFAVGDYKRRPNVVGGRETTRPKDVPGKMNDLLRAYNSRESVTIYDIIAFHAEFEKIHPFQDGNGRVGRLVALKECLKWNVLPFIIEDSKKLYYYRGLSEWDHERGYLEGTCLDGQDTFRRLLELFEIPVF